MKIDILDFEFYSKGRDIDMSEPILSYMELKYNLNIKRGCCFGNWRQFIVKYKPQIIFIANGVGSKEHFLITKTASKLGIKVVTHVSEGDYVAEESGFLEFYWGWNRDRIKYEDLQLEWSQRNINLINKFVGQSDKIKLSGAVGFDKYKFFEFKTKKYFLEKYNKTQFEKVIGIAGWGFDLFLSDYFDKHREFLERRFTANQIENIRESKDILLGIIKEVILQNPDILFILKYHPMIIDKRYSEFYELDSFNNTLVITKEEPIFDVINASDLWFAYESTTAMEAWLIGNTPTFVIQPIDNDFTRSNIAEGSYRLKDSNEFQSVINEFYNSGKVESFDALADKRNEIIETIIQWRDGKNHQRAAEYIYELYKKDKKINTGNYLIFRISYFFIQFKFLFKKITKKLFGRKSYFSHSEREHWHEVYFKAVKKFHNL